MDAGTTATAAEVSATDLRGSIPALTGIRGYAALWVVVSHVWLTDVLFAPLGVRAPWRRLAGIVEHEYLAVDLFFMLSGFVLLHVHGHEFQRSLGRTDYGRFLLLRLARIYPLHLFALLVAFLAHSALPDPEPTNTPQSLVLQLALMSSWGVTPSPSWNPPAWSLSAEWFAYLLLPLIALGITGLQTVTRLLTTLACVALVFYFLMFCQPTKLDYCLGVGAQVRVLAGVAIGAVLRQLYEIPRVRALPWTLIFYLCLPVAALTMSELSGARRPDSMVSYVMIILIVFAAACSDPRGAGPLVWRIPRYLGEISYAIYIVHYPVLRVLRFLLHSELDKLARSGTELQIWCALLVVVGVVLSVAGVVSDTIEVPFRRWAKAALTLPKRAATPPGAAMCEL